MTCVSTLSTTKKSVTNFTFCYNLFLLFSKFISRLSKKFHTFEVNFLFDDSHGVEEDVHALSIFKLL